MKHLNVTLLCLGLLLPLGAELAWGGDDSTGSTVISPAAKWPSGPESGTLLVECPEGTTCTLDLSAGHWIIRTPVGQTIDAQETDNETRYRIETPRQFGKPKP